jgi:RND family efflux transporter MFP subunit
MKARVKSAKSDLEASLAAVIQAEATAKSSAAWVRFRAKQYLRMQELFTLKSIDERLVDESKERYEASIETEQSAKAAILTSKAHVSAAESKVDAAQADVAVAEADVDVAQAELEKYTVQQGFATITAPFDGVVSHRSSFPGDFVRSAESNGNEPLLTVQRTDLMRVIVQVPDRDVPFADPGDPAIVSIDALGGDPLPAKISRIAKSEDPQTRLMHIEIDLPNPTGAICHGMYGRVSIVLDKAAGQLCIPSACLVGKADHGVGAVYVVRDHHAHLTKVRLGIDNGLLVGVVSGLSIDEEIILQPGNVISEGALVSPTCDEVEQKVASK